MHIICAFPCSDIKAKSLTAMKTLLDVNDSLFKKLKGYDLQRDKEL